MSRHTIECDLWVPVSIDEVWSFMKDPANLAKMTPSKFGTSVDFQGPLLNGTRAQIKISVLGVPLISWVAAFSDVLDSGNQRQFVDTQERGPFAFWKHRHLFEAGSEWVEGKRSGSKVRLEKPGTWIRDRVEYEVPAGPIGDLMDRIRIRRELEKLFAYRHEKLREFWPID